MFCWGLKREVMIKKLIRSKKGASCKVKRIEVYGLRKTLTNILNNSKEERVKTKAKQLLKETIKYKNKHRIEWYEIKEYNILIDEVLFLETIFNKEVH